MELEKEILENRIIILDSPMGTGKTTRMIEYMNDLNHDQKIIYITPYNDECERIVKACTKKQFIAPDIRHGKGSKSRHLLDLIRDGENIAATHSLFSRISDELIEALRQSDYHLILDEAFNVVEKFDMWKDDYEYKRSSQDLKDNLTKKTIKSLFDLGCIAVDENYKVSWIDEEHDQPKYETFKRLCDRELIYLINGELLLWSFPIECFLPGVFEKIFILTYMFDYQFQSYYYNCFNVPYIKTHIEKINNKFTIIKTVNSEYEKDWILKAKTLINIIDGSVNKKGIFINNYGQIIQSALSKTWYRNTLKKLEHKKIDELKKGMITFFMNYSGKTKSQDRMWTTFDVYKKLFKDKNISNKNHVACNARATNDYGNKKVLAYMINKYVDPFYVHFFIKKNISINKDGYALIEMLQWIWRSQVRNNLPIAIYIPSERMRNILKDYLDLKTLEFKDAQEDLSVIEDEKDD